ncbi:hypothetical protein MGN70_010123 [Eutypa lata]|nr:hypothetical protein MGN70_010123 [Eutypa lata]
MPAELPILTIADAVAWSHWLTRSAETSRGVWLTLAKKGTTSPTSLTYAQALDEALCHGWIDGQASKRDEATYAQRFTPRTAKSSWSQRNVAHAARLESEGRMTVLGRRAIDAAKADGRWDAAYAGSATAELPPEFLAAAAMVPEAQALLEGLSSQNRFIIYHRINALKTQTGRQKRIKAFVDMLARGETPYPQKMSTEPKQTQKQTQKTTAKPVPVNGKSTSRVSKRVVAPSAESGPTGRDGSMRRSARLRKVMESLD